MNRDLDGTRLFVGDLASFCDESHIQEIFESNGFEIVNVKLMRGKQSLSSLSYGFAQLRSREDAVKAIALLDGKLVYGRNIKVRWASQGSGKKNPTSVNSIYVKFQALENNIDVTEETLRHVFSTYGVVTDASVKASNMTRHANECDSGYGFVHFQEGENGIAAAFRAIGDLSSSPVIDKIEFVCEPSQNLLRNVHQMKKERKYEQGSQHERSSLPPNVGRSSEKAFVGNGSYPDRQDLDYRFGTRAVYCAERSASMSQGYYHPGASSQYQIKSTTRNLHSAPTSSYTHHRSPVDTHIGSDDINARQVNNTKQPNLHIYYGPPILVLPSPDGPSYSDLSSTAAQVNNSRHSGSISESLSYNYGYGPIDVFTPSSLEPDPLHVSPSSVSIINNMTHPYESLTIPSANSLSKMDSNYEDTRKVFTVPRTQFFHQSQGTTMYGNPTIKPIKTSNPGVLPMHPYNGNTLYMKSSPTGQSIDRHVGQDARNESNAHVPTSGIEYSMQNLALHNRYASNNMNSYLKLGSEAPLKDSSSYTTDSLTVTGESESSCTIYRGSNSSPRGDQVSSNSLGLEACTAPYYHDNPTPNIKLLSFSQHMTKLSSKSPTARGESAQLKALPTNMDHIN